MSDKILEIACELNKSEYKENIKNRADCSTENCKICCLESFMNQKWKNMLENEFKKNYFTNIKEKLHTVPIFYPSIEKIFHFTHFSSFEDIKVVILGQDPYHNPGQAMGLSFSVPKSIKIPPSLINIYEELSTDIIGFKKPNHGDLTGWAKQGVLLLNDTLTVAKNEPASHANIGWKIFTQIIIELINDKLNNVVFILWGNHAKQKGKILDKSKHLILEAGHPSPFSVKLFRGCKHFSKANEYLRQHGKDEIDWSKL